MPAKRQSTSISQTAKTAQTTAHAVIKTAQASEFVVQERVNEVVTGEGSKAPRLEKRPNADAARDSEKDSQSKRRQDVWWWDL
ncbi:hypothetical protein E5D57_004490 [Metarhizium anisopliae]|nr:hypothetical protein E5D57_004490 [Metarhizium anisopliae]